MSHMPSRQLILLAASCALAACSTAYTPVPLRSALEGSDLSPRVELSGRIYSTNSEVFSLYPPESSSGGRTCIALILSDSDRHRASAMNGVLVRVRASLIGAGDMNMMLQRPFGEINGRPWSGTFCDGEYVAYVDEITTADRTTMAGLR